MQSAIIFDLNNKFILSIDISADFLYATIFSLSSIISNMISCINSKKKKCEDN